MDRETVFQWQKQGYNMMIRNCVFQWQKQGYIMDRETVFQWQKQDYNMMIRNCVFQWQKQGYLWWTEIPCFSDINKAMWWQVDAITCVLVTATRLYDDRIDAITCVSVSHTKLKQLLIVREMSKRIGILIKTWTQAESWKYFSSYPVIKSWFFIPYFMFKALFLSRMQISGIIQVALCSMRAIHYRDNLTIQKRMSWVMPECTHRQLRLKVPASSTNISSAGRFPLCAAHR